MEIQKIQIEGFQSHKKTELEPAPSRQLTVIVGPSDSGKTAIIRALRWLYYDIPRGTDFISVQERSARVTLSLADGNKVVRERSRTTYNRYLVNDQRFEGFKNIVPAEVMENTGVRPVTVGDLVLNLNLAEQLDGPFLGKSVSAPAKAKVLGKLAGTEEIDLAARQLNTDLFRRRQEEKNLVNNINRLREEIKEFDYLPELKGEIEAGKNLLAAVKAATEKKALLEKLREELRKVNAGIIECESKVERLTVVINDGMQTFVAASVNVDSFTRLSALKANLTRVNLEIAIAQGILDKTSGVGVIHKMITSAVDKTERFNKLKGFARDIGRVSEELQLVAQIIARTAGIPEANMTAPVVARNIEQLRRLKELQDQLHSAKNGISTSQKCIGRLTPLIDAEPKLINTATTIDRIGRLQNLSEALNNVSLSLKVWDMQLRRLSKLDGAGEAIGNIEESCHRLTLLCMQKGQLQAWERDIKTTAVYLQKLESKVSAAKEEYQNLLIESGTCPLCGADTTQFKLKEVV